MAHKVWKCVKCNRIPETGLVYKEGICEKCHEKVIKVSPSHEDIIAHIKAVNSKCGNMSYDEELKKACNIFKLHELHCLIFRKIMEVKIALKFFMLVKVIILPEKNMMARF